MKVRTAIEKDIPDILALIRGKAEFNGCIEQLRSGEEDIKNAFFVENPKAKALVVETNGKVIGIATYYEIYSTFIAKPGIWLDDLFVYAGSRQSGAGKALIKALCPIAKEQGCGHIDWIVARDNFSGRQFYESIGAHIFEEVRHSRLDENAINQLLRA